MVVSPSLRVVIHDMQHRIEQSLFQKLAGI